MNGKMTLVAALVLALTAPASFAATKAEKKADAKAVDTACAQDAQTAGCGNKVVGKGLLKCMHAYKKKHKDFTYSEGCSTAIKKFNGDRK